MNLLWEGVVQAFRLILKGDSDVFHAVYVSLQVSIAATLFAAAFGVPVGFVVETRTFRGKRAVVA